MTNIEYAEALRRLAAIYENNATIPQMYEGTGSAMLAFAQTKEEFTAIIRAFGAGAKSADEDSLHFIPEFPLQIKVYAFKSNICTKRTVERVIPATVIPARPAQPAQPATEETVIPERVELVTEYVCEPSFLREKQVVTTPVVAAATPVDEQHAKA